MLPCAACALEEIQNNEAASWEQRAENITIIRDDWGIPHIYGETDADAVFGMIYAQAEDNFNRIEVNFLNSQARLAEAEGEAEIWRDLRMKLFIDPEDMRNQYDASPAWLKDLMDAWADGLNHYLYTHPGVAPKVITRFEPWMALTFSEGSIGGDIRTRVAEPARSLLWARVQRPHGIPGPGLRSGAVGLKRIRHRSLEQRLG